ncbi:hypothetical protein AMTRI_Chr03g45290 [Amborella trichopoda]
MFWFPLVPSTLDYFHGHQECKPCLSINGTHASPSGTHDEAEGNSGVPDFITPWKSDVGEWLSGCHSRAIAVHVNETIAGKCCKNDCNGQGICNQNLGHCRCFHGYAEYTFECNFPSSLEDPDGKWSFSICTAYCDTTRAKCFCGEGTKYPNRLVVDAYGFQQTMYMTPSGPTMTRTVDRENNFTTNSSIAGWCNVDPEDAYGNKARVRDQCECRYDGLWGRLCEIPSLSTCVNQWSGHGHCHGGFCRCHSSWYGIDCSIPSIQPSTQEWPKGLRPNTVMKQVNGDYMNFTAVVTKKRPLIYIYDLPAEFHSHRLEGRHFKYECVNRNYNLRNETLWLTLLYGAQMALYESILISPYRTTNGEEADYCYVLVLDSCLINCADAAPHLSSEAHGGLRTALNLEYNKRAYDHIRGQYPYWNRTYGRDHTWFFSWDEGAYAAPKEIWNRMMVVHCIGGNTNSKHNYSTMAFERDKWDQIPREKRADHVCFDPDKDLVLRAWKPPDAFALKSREWARPLGERMTLLYFNGNLGAAYEVGRSEETFSMGIIRQKLAAEFGSTPNKEGKLGKQHASDVIITPERSDYYHEELASSIFSHLFFFFFRGNGPLMFWFMTLALPLFLDGEVTILPIPDGIFLPYENVINFDSFAVLILEDEISNIVNILRQINEREREFKLANVQKIWIRFLYCESVMLEEYSKLVEDDVFSTFIQPQQRDYGLPGTCSRETAKEPVLTTMRK